ncbi:hypothetical protein MSI_00430 [Treponema sp. JC4]|nr:hypothetical protein MSI_00430 [Treponema sp. JC4]
MKGFLSFRHFKKLLKTIVFCLLLLNTQNFFSQTAYRWSGNGNNTNWSNYANWEKYTGSSTVPETIGRSEDTDWTATGENEYPHTDTDAAFVTGEAVTTITLDKSIVIHDLYLNTKGSNKITINLSSFTIICTVKLMLIAENNAHSINANVDIIGSGTFQANTLDFPSSGTHTLTIADQTTKLIITETLWANSNGTLTFQGDGYLYMPNGGGIVNWGPANIKYLINAEKRLPYEGEGVTPAYSCNITIPDNFPTSDATITFTRRYFDSGEWNLNFPYKVEIAGDEEYTITEVGNTTNSKVLVDGEIGTGNISSGDSIIYARPTDTTHPIVNNKVSTTYKLSCSDSITTKKNGITIKFYSPDGKQPEESFMEIGRLSWHYKSPTWTGAEDHKWTNKNNWSYSGIAGFDPSNLGEYDIVISEQSSSRQPVIESNISVGSLTITGGSKVTHKSGQLSTNKIVTTGTGKFISEKNAYGTYDGTLELAKLNNSQSNPTLIRAFSDSITLGNLSIGQDASFTMPFDMNLTMLTLNSGSSFSKGTDPKKKLTLGWLQVQTASYSPVTNKNITLTEDFEANSIIILLRDGNITAEKTLSAKKDFIIGGANYKYTIYTYEQFTNRPDGWIDSFTPVSLDINPNDPWSDSSTFYLSAGADIKAGTSGEGNFFIDGANLYGSSGGNKIIIPQNDSAEHFCAYSIFSTIRNITVACSDGSEDGSKAQIPVGGGSVDNTCHNFDKENFIIESAETVFDNKIKITMNRETRNTQGELSDQKIINAITVSDGNYFTSTEVPQDTSINPDPLRPTVFYIETDKTTWNMDATGNMDPSDPQAVIVACNYTDSKSEWRSVVPCLTIPQTSDYGFTITDKWGKHLEPYSPYTGTSDGTDKTPTWSGQADTSWAIKRNWYNLHKDKSLEQNLQENDITIKPTANSPVISTRAASNQSWQVKSMTIEAGASLTIENMGMLNAGSFTNNGSFTQTGGMLQLSGATAKIKYGTDAVTSIKSMEVLSGTALSLESPVSVTNLILNDNLTISTATNPLTTTNLLINAQAGSLNLAENYSAKNIYFLSGTTDIADSISSEYILAYGGTINLSTATSLLAAEKDFIILGTEYKPDESDLSKFNYNHFAARPDGWTSVNIPVSDIGKLPDESKLQTFSAKITATAGATLSAGTAALSASGGNGNLYINGTSLTGTGEWFISIPQNDTPETFCTEAIEATITNCTVKCLSDNSSDGSKAQIPYSGTIALDNCKNFDSDELNIEEAHTVYDNRIYLKFPREIRKIIDLNAITTSDGKGFTAEYYSENGSDVPPALKSHVYLYTDQTCWNMDATGTSAGGDDYTNHTGIRSENIPSLTIPQYVSDSSGNLICGYLITDKWGKRLKAYSPLSSAYTDVTDGVPREYKWTGVADEKWENEDNWYFSYSTKTFEDCLKTFDITIPAAANQPLFTADSGSYEVKSLKITENAKLTMTGGNLTINRIELTDKKTDSDQPGIFEAGSGTVIFEKLTDESTQTIINPSFSSSQPELSSFYDLKIKSGTFEYRDFPLTNDLYLFASVDFKKDSAIPGNFYIKTEEAQTFNFDISAKNIIVYSGSLTVNKTLSALNDLIILGTNYQNSTFTYDHFATRPAGWTDVNIPVSDLLALPDGTVIDKADLNASLLLSDNAALKAGNSSDKKGNFYINGASLTGGADSSIIIPQNDSPENFCAEAINSNISNITVQCEDGSSNGSKAQIPAEDCTLTTCKNFDYEDFEITKAYTVTDNRIHLEFDNKKRPLRNTNSELADSNLINEINIGDSMSIYGKVTAVYNSKSGTGLPAANPTAIYIVSSTTWNTDASGTYVGSGRYTDSTGHFKRVKTSLYIPQYIFDYDENNQEFIIISGYLLTDKWGKRLKNYTYDPDDYSDRSFTAVTDGIPESEKTPRIPPSFSAVLSAIGGNKISLTFSKPIVTDNNKISYYYLNESTMVVTRETITQPMKEIFPRCFELISIDASGNPVSSDLQIDKSQTATIENTSSGLEIVTLKLTRNVTLADIQNLYIRLVHPKKDDGSNLYPPTNYDHVTEEKGVYVSFIQETDKDHLEDGENCMILKTAHTISDFALGAVSPSYAYLSAVSTAEGADQDFFKNIYSENSEAVHDFSKSQKNYGTLPYGQEISIVSKVNTGNDSAAESDYPPVLKLFITDSPDSASVFPTLNTNYDKTSEAWLPDNSGASIMDFHSYTPDFNSHFLHDLEKSRFINDSPLNGYIIKIPQEKVKGFRPGSQTDFLYMLCDSAGAFIPHYLSPQCDYEHDTYTLTNPNPLFAFTLSNPADLLSLTPWYMTLKSINEQRGGVTILNNVINSLNGEKTVVKVNMPSSGNLDVIVMTLDGNIVKYLNRGSASAGEHFYYWDGKNNAGSPCARGMYFVIIKAAGIDETRKVMVVK